VKDALVPGRVELFVRLAAVKSNPGKPLCASFGSSQAIEGARFIFDQAKDVESALNFGSKPRPQQFQQHDIAHAEAER